MMRVRRVNHPRFLIPLWVGWLVLLGALGALGWRILEAPL